MHAEVVGNIKKLSGKLHLSRFYEPQEIDWADFLRGGTINAVSSDEVIAYPLSVEFYKHGDKQPDETVCREDCFWITCIMIDNQQANDIFNAAQFSHFAVGSARRVDDRVLLNHVGVFPWKT